MTSAFSIYGVFFYRKNGTLPGSSASQDPETVKSDDLEFTGASPHAYNVLNAQQEMQQQHDESHNQDFTSPLRTPGEEGVATLPPRPLYSKAPRSPTMDHRQPTMILTSTILDQARTKSIAMNLEIMNCLANTRRAWQNCQP